MAQVALDHQQISDLHVFRFWLSTNLQDKIYSVEKNSTKENPRWKILERTPHKNLYEEKNGIKDENYQQQRLWFEFQSHYQLRQWRCVRNVSDRFFLVIIVQQLLTCIQWPANESQFTKWLNKHCSKFSSSHWRIIAKKSDKNIPYIYKWLAMKDSNVPLFVNSMRLKHHLVFLTS